MKTLKLLFLFLMISALGSSCLRDKCDATRDYVQFNPVYMTGDQLSYEIKTIADKALVNPGKIYFYKNYLFINEQGEGIHVYNNENPAAPVHETFYSIPGNFDIAIKDDVLFADNPLYLMSIDISSITNPQIKSREKLKDYDWLYENLDNQHVIYYTRSNIVESFDCSDSNWGQQRFRRNDNIFVDFNGSFDGNVISSESSGNNGNSGSGVGGSFARFTIYDNYLYTVDESSLNVWDIARSTNPEKISTKHLGWGIETIFPSGSNLFIGSSAGMFIFDNSDPTNPVLSSTFTHAQACDPVVVSGNKAYVTLRDGNDCNGFENQLDVIDVSNINNPKLIKSYDMKNPHGLAIRDNKLFICEGSFGLKIFDASDDQKIDKNELVHIKDINAYDVISLSPEILFLIGSDGFFQYKVTDAKNPKLISSILVQK